MLLPAAARSTDRATHGGGASACCGRAAKIRLPPARPISAEVAKIAHGRPHLIKLVRNVLLEGLTLIDSPSWTVNPVFSEFVTVRGVTIVNPPDSPNTDGINPESCRNAHISDCHIDVGDDCVTIKSGTDEVGAARGQGVRERHGNQLHHDPRPRPRA